ncbi:YbhB/YbcL family Raf kinase inhibitor-like protein [Persicimonas caeni]|uniref:YbhB/YbcL family Raf kinase inhibitor-like protein n=1 Tax=Persicimonas caeni TaxID=2292766 RepID=A0A4Y6PZN7_PERCE|nr:YbhB/YbcL family Raf kinase inhibitor-like protein [Persicimonas caeni]QDG53791.1 YbhB/YbcL family Raf kinase inhibitor-like protein [Persicimonas caeni]QED35012.1 YbhB/YbcL family Raf kinase inhibitor-like protein [Persicimonas caeni]
MRYRVIMLSALLIMAAGCETETPDRPEDPTVEATTEQGMAESPEAADEQAQQDDQADDEGGGMEFGLSTTAFEDGGMLPTKFTCDAEGMSPPLTWSQPPDGTESYAIIMTDPDAPQGTFHHWGMWGIPGEEHALGENVPHVERIVVTTPGAPETDVDAFQAINDFDKLGYGAPCPPKGDKPHRYVFRIYAIDHPGAKFDEVPTVEQLVKVVTEDAIGQAEITATYERKAE